MSVALSVKLAMEFLLAHECRFNLFAFFLRSLSAKWGLGFDGVMSESNSLNSHSNTVFYLVERSSALSTFISSTWDISEKEVLEAWVLNINLNSGSDGWCWPLSYCHGFLTTVYEFEIVILKCLNLKWLHKKSSVDYTPRFPSYFQLILVFHLIKHIS